MHGQRLGSGLQSRTWQLNAFNMFPGIEPGWRYECLSACADVQSCVGQRAGRICLHHKQSAMHSAGGRRLSKHLFDADSVMPASCNVNLTNVRQAATRSVRPADGVPGKPFMSKLPATLRTITFLLVTKRRVPYRPQSH